LAKYPRGGHNQSYKDKKGMRIMKKIAKSVTGFFTVVITGIIEGRQAQAEYIAKHHHWY
jgi:hypothetical protein